MSNEMYPVRVVFDPYSHAAVKTLLDSVRQEYGANRDRWFWKLDKNDSDPTPNQWVMQFFFKDPYDATMFALKYSR